jgi:DNA-binding IclR family transcriptional regulator
LTEQEVLVLEMLIRAETMSPAEIAKQTGIPAGGVEQLLERMVQLHYVSRKGARYEAEARRRSP